VIFLPGGVVEAIDRLYRAVARRGRAGEGPPAALGPAS
jgi:hypothetical protein